jgi:hypothetical protein
MSIVTPGTISLKRAKIRLNGVARQVAGMADRVKGILIDSKREFTSNFVYTKIKKEPNRNGVRIFFYAVCIFLNVIGSP